jgi:hypothetical protein
MARTPILILSFVAAALTAGCNQGPSPSQVELQQKLVDAQARADAAEKRAKNAEIAHSLHAQEPLKADANPPAADADPAENDFGKPINDTQPIEPAPAVPAGPSQ